ncbi:MAG: polyisoprenoid-binding protein [Granulosicoccus sp.]|nr:polyisoprenoid-binding protein [Granulosicoccus sp.]
MSVRNKFREINAIGAFLLMAGSLHNALAGDLSAIPSGSYKLDPTHAYINFQYSHLGLSHPTLGFDDFTVDLNLDSADPTKSILLVKIDSRSIITGSAILKEGLEAEELFDVTNHPEILYQSTRIEKAGDDAYTVAGDLTIKGESRPVTLDVTINGAMNHPVTGKPVMGIDATGMLLRSDFGLDKFVPAVGDEVTIEISAELVKAE